MTEEITIRDERVLPFGINGEQDLSYIWDRTKASGGSLLVLLAVAHDCMGYGNSKMTVGSLAKKTRMAVIEVHAALRDLYALGELGGGEVDSSGAVSHYISL